MKTNIDAVTVLEEIKALRPDVADVLSGREKTMFENGFYKARGEAIEATERAATQPSTSDLIATHQVPKAKAMAELMQGAAIQPAGAPFAYAIYGIGNGRHFVKDIRQVEPEDDGNWKLDDAGMGEYWAGNEPLYLAAPISEATAPSAVVVEDLRYCNECGYHGLAHGEYSYCPTGSGKVFTTTPATPQEAKAEQVGSLRSYSHSGQAAQEQAQPFGYISKAEAAKLDNKRLAGLGMMVSKDPAEHRMAIYVTPPTASTALALTDADILAALAKAYYPPSHPGNELLQRVFPDDLLKVVRHLAGNAGAAGA